MKTWNVTSITVHASMATTTPKESDAEQQDYSCDSDAVSYDRTAKLLSVGDE